MTLTLKNRKLLAGTPLIILSACGLVFLTIPVVATLAALPWWASSYLDDFLCLPLVLGLILLAHRQHRLGPQETLGWAHGLVALLVLGLVFELILPRLSLRYTADHWDLAMYCAGLVLFQLGINRPLRLR